MEIYMKHASNTGGESRSHAPRGKLSGGRLSAVITAAILLIVIGINVIFGILAFRQRLIVDLTEEGIYTVHPVYRALLDSTFASVSEKRQAAGEEPVKVQIIFCDDPDVLTANGAQRYVYYTALSLAKLYPDYISVECVDVALNPSAVQAYKTNSASRIYPSSIIVASGTEFRVYAVNSFFYFDTNDYAQSSPIGYCGDKAFTQAIRNVTSAESPVCCLITDHGETYGEAFIDLLSDAGYRVVKDFDLSRDEIPADCRMMISAGPKTDYYAVFGDMEAEPGRMDEIDRLSGFLDTLGSFMFFFDPDTPKLRNIEEYLVEWGVIVDRSGGEAFTVTDMENSISADGGTLIGQYETTGLGGSILSDMLSSGSPEKVVFPHCGSISRPSNYKTSFMDANEDDGIPKYQFGSYSSGGVNRSAFNFFLAGENATATAGDLVSNTGSNSLMTVTMEYRMVAEDKGYTWVTQASYVVACASTEFLSDEVLTGTRFGNTDVMLSSLRTMGRDVNPTDNVYRMFHKSELGTVHRVSDADKTQITVWLAVLPAVILLAACVIVLVKRRNKA